MTAGLVLAVLLAAAIPAAAAPALFTSWGKAGDGKGEFNAPHGITIGRGGDVYTVESGVNRVQRFRASGAFRLSWGNGGPAGSSAPGKFSAPEGIAADSAGNVYVADGRNDRIQKFNHEGVFIKSWGGEGTGAGRFNDPTKVAVDAARNVYVADFGNSRVQKFSADGAFLGQWGSEGTGPGQFKWLDGIAVSRAGDVYTLELDNHRVQRFTASGTFVGQWGSQGTGDGQFQSPSGIEAGPDGRVYVVDRGRDDVQVFSAAGAYLDRFGSSGSRAGQFEIPVDVAVDARGVVYVVDNLSSRVQAFAERPPESVDTDGDALPDAWELFGLDLNHDGKVDVDLRAMGADALHKDVFVQLDYFTNHQLTNIAMDKVMQAFARAPVSNPDGRSGISVHIDNGPDSVMNPATGQRWGTLSEQNQFRHINVIAPTAGNDLNWSSIDLAKRTYVPTARLRVFHYAMSGHRYQTSSNTSGGISRGIPASDFLVTLQGFCAPNDCSGSDDLQAVVFMHELGHGLGLRHGGADNVNYKPNYLSIMNYTFSIAGLKIGGAVGGLDYSEFGPPHGGLLSDPVVANLDEANLDENAGFGTSSSNLARYSSFTWCNGWTELRVGLGADWNCDKTLGKAVKADINADGSRGMLTTQDDWQHLVFDGGTIGDPSSAAPSPLPRTTPRQERPASTLLKVARAVTGDRRAPRVLITGSTTGRRRVRLTIRATDNKGVQVISVQTDKTTRSYRGKGRRSVTVYVTVTKRGRHTVRAIALDRTGNNGRSRTVKVRVG